MADFLYDKARESFLSQNPSIDFDTDTIKIALVGSGYTASQSADDFWNDASSAVIGTPATLASKTVTSGVADAADVTFSAVASGSTVTQLVIYKDTGTSSTSPLIAHIDSYTGLPLSTNGGDITIQFPSDSNKIFKL